MRVRWNACILSGSKQMTKSLPGIIILSFASMLYALAKCHTQLLGISEVCYRDRDRVKYVRMGLCRLSLWSLYICRKIQAAFFSLNYINFFYRAKCEPVSCNFPPPSLPNMSYTMIASNPNPVSIHCYYYFLVILNCFHHIL